MAATISHLNSSNSVIRWNLHNVSPSATALFSRQVFSNNVTFSLDFNQISSKLSVSTTSAIHKCHAITSPCKNVSASTFSSYSFSDLLEKDSDACIFIDDHVKNSNASPSTSGSSIFKVFGDNNVVSMQIMLSSQNSAFAASYGRMGGSSSYKSSPSSSPSYKSSSRTSSYISDSEPKNYPSLASATTPTCICNCHKEDKNETLTSNSCTDCNCSKDGSSVQNTKKSKAPLIILALAALGAIAKFVSGGGGPGSVFMVQVGISDKERVLQKKINKIADSADTSTVDGLNYVLKGVVKALLEHHDSCRFAYFYDKFGNSMKKSVRPSFEELLNREIDRFDKDENTLVNVDGVKYKKEVVAKSNYIANEYSVVTLLVLASDFKLDESVSRSTGHLKSLLQTIQTIPKKSIKSVEVLWTPQREDETVSEQELRRDFPLMEVV
ncbi:hypothetical protein POM88_035108 [Heracleum sosnowskyi]|uniref:Uncharacterized protein n=1 Tax=Heracleum sosnowskyi TaxID=360622 RepID=A0AAD8MCX4_9APIA|nr:hypothetical protein POM88_035108 [Heracleum sosnowskyi]